MNFNNYNITNWFNIHRWVWNFWAAPAPTDSSERESGTGFASDDQQQQTAEDHRNNEDDIITLHSDSVNNAPVIEEDWAEGAGEMRSITTEGGVTVDIYPHLTDDIGSDVMVEGMAGGEAVISEIEGVEETNSIGIYAVADVSLNSEFEHETVGVTDVDETSDTEARERPQPSGHRCLMMRRVLRWPSDWKCSENKLCLRCVHKS